MREAPDRMRRVAGIRLAFFRDVTNSDSILFGYIILNLIMLFLMNYMNHELLLVRTYVGIDNIIPQSSTETILNNSRCTRTTILLSGSVLRHSYHTTRT